MEYIKYIIVSTDISGCLPVKKAAIVERKKSPNKKNDKDTFLWFTIKYNKLTAKYIIIYIRIESYDL